MELIEGAGDAAINGLPVSEAEVTKVTNDPPIFGGVFQW